jgi:serine/threonine-protein kinase TNNI3K
MRASCRPSAWDSFSDLCVLSEFMAGGDLRAQLVHFEATGHPQGFDHDKVRIALHVAHALTYLHSLPRPVLHRDLKSKNVLLTPALDAKLADFGVSRERADRTMTAGVGTSLWMAPEVMVGDRYGVAADMFSFGVLLSELDTHSLPYAHATDRDGDGHRLPDAAVLQMVAAGSLRVEFSADALHEVVALGEACVSVDPAARPTAAEALGKLHSVLHRI